MKQKTVFILLFVTILSVFFTACDDPKAITPPNAPIKPNITPANGSLTVSWSAVEGAESYSVYCSSKDTAADAEEIATGITELTYTIDKVDGNALVNGTTYYVWLKAANTAGTSGFSPMASGIPSEPFQVTYNANGGSGVMPIDNNMYYPGNTVTVLQRGNIADGAVAKEDSNFTGWNTKSDGTGTTYIGGDTFELTEGITLYAKWQACTSYDSFSLSVEDSAAIIVGYTGSNNEIVLSEVYNNNGSLIPVTSIGDEVFKGCPSLTTITLPDSLTSIGDAAFVDCSGLSSITLSASLTSIGGGAFSDCSGLTSITLPDSLTSIGEQAFYNCSSLTSITLPDSLTSIGGGTFAVCSGLTSITLPDSLTSIGERAFAGCNLLKTIIVGEANYNYCSFDGVLFNKDKTTLICYPKGKGNNYTVPTTVTSIGDWAFAYCDGLTSITLPDSLTNIGNDAFYICSSLTSITLPDSLTSIGDEAFYDCSGLPSITLPDSLTSIGDAAFVNCSDLTSITLPNSLTSIGERAFSFCSGLTSITLPDSLTNIGKNAFCQCSGLTSVFVLRPSSSGITTLGICVFDNTDSLTIYVPDADSVTAYKDAENWSDYADYIIEGLPSGD